MKDAGKCGSSQFRLARFSTRVIHLESNVLVEKSKVIYVAILNWIQSPCTSRVLLGFQCRRSRRQGMQAGTSTWLETFWTSPWCSRPGQGKCPQLASRWWHPFHHCEAEVHFQKKKFSISEMMDLVKWRRESWMKFKKPRPYPLVASVMMNCALIFGSSKHGKAILAKVSQYWDVAWDGCIFFPFVVSRICFLRTSTCHCRSRRAWWCTRL